ncbi:MAG: amidase [Myxococcota bacterium]
MATKDGRGNASTNGATLSRRRFLGAAGGAGLGLAATGCAAPRTSAPTAPENDLLAGDALDQAARVRSGEATAEELVRATIERIEALNGPINAVVTTFYERALSRAAGPLPNGPFRGVPFLLKDLNDLAGTPTSMGSRLFEGHVAAESSPHTAAALASGFIVLGKTNTPEFGLVATTESAALGICRNPWNLDHSAGGSSGGAAAAVAAGMIPMAQASDGGGSIRIPASCNGVFGLKPSRGRNRAAAQTRAVDISVKHSVSRSVRDTAAYTTVVQRTDPAARFAPIDFVEGPADRRLRIGFFTRNGFGEEAHPEVKRCLEASAALCEGLGHEVIATDFDLEGEAFFEHFLNLWASIPAGIVEQAKQRGFDPPDVLEPVTLGLAERFSRAPANAIPAAVDFLEGYAGRIDARRSRFDVLLCPVLRDPPAPIGTYAGTRPFDAVFEPMIGYVGYTPTWNATGHPGMSVPLGVSVDGLPIGSQFIAGHGDERTLLELAYELEAAQPWADRRPA